MAKKKKIQIPVKLLIKIGMVAFIFLCGFLLSQTIMKKIVHSPIFKVKKVIIDSSLDFLTPDDINGLKGKNIFFVDLKGIKKRLESRYAQIMQLKIQKNFPNEIIITAKKRDPYIQLKVNNRLITLDNKGIVLSLNDKLDENLPQIEGVPIDLRTTSVRLPLRNEEVLISMATLKSFKEEPLLKSFVIKSINIESINKIQLSLSNGLFVYLPQEKMNEKLKMLGAFLSQNTMDTSKTEYLDLRFNQPVLKLIPEKETKSSKASVKLKKGK